MLQTGTVKATTLGLLKALPEIRMLGYAFDFSLIEKRIVKMTDYPDKVYATAPLKRNRNTVL